MKLVERAVLSSSNCPDRGCQRFGILRPAQQWVRLRKLRLRLPKVDVECAGMTQPDLFPRQVCLLRKEDVSLFYFGHNIGVSLGFLMMNALAVDHLAHLDEVR